MSPDHGTPDPLDAPDQREPLDDAIEALRNAAPVQAPPAALGTRTLAALRRAGGPAGDPFAGRTKAMKLAIKLAAAVAIAVVGTVVFLALRSAKPETIVDPSPYGPRIDVVPPVDRGTPPPRPTPIPTAPPQPAVAAATGESWCIAGTVRFEGEAPEPAQIDVSAVKECASQHPGGLHDDSVLVRDGRLANAVVWVRPAEGRELPGAGGQRPPGPPAVLDQKGCRYVPRVLAVRVGQALLVRNGDNFLHNVHALSVTNPAFNFGQPTRDPNGRYVPPMKAAEVFKIKCDVHPWMSAYVHVIDHPYFAVTGDDGAFAIPGELPDGAYILVAWHERLGEQEIRVDVKGGKASGAELVFTVAQ